MDDRLKDDIDTIMRENLIRVENMLHRHERRIHSARMRQIEDTPKDELIPGRRGHAHGHDQGPDWRERNV